MTKASDNVFPRFLISEGGSTATPASGNVTVYAKADGLLYSKDDAGAETLVSGGGGAVATDAIWDAAGDLAVGSGADTAAKLTKGAAGANLSTYNGAVAWNGGTSFPASPTTGDRYWRSDLGMEAYYDGTRWLSTQIHTIPLTHEDSGFTWGTTVSTLPVHRGVVPYGGTYDLWLVAWDALSMVLTTNSGSAYWTGRVVKYNSALAGDTVIATFNTSADSPNTGVPKSVAIGALLGSYVGFYTESVKTSTPGTFRLHGGHMTCRLVLT